MHARLLRYTLYTAALPLSAVIFILAFQHNIAAANLAMVLLTILQIPMLLICRKALRPFIAPDFQVLKEMGVKYVPVAYEPGRFKIDSRVSSVLTWFSLASPFLVWLAIQFPTEVSVSVLNGAAYTSPSMSFLIPALFLIVISTLAFPFWFETSRAAAVYAEGSEQKRYLLCGFADRLETNGGATEYMRLHKGFPLHHPASRIGPSF